MACWLWVLAGVVAVVVVGAALGRLDAVRGELAQAVRDSDPAATPERVTQVVDLSVLAIVGGGLLCGVVGALLAAKLRNGRRWARLTLTFVAVLVVAYGVLVLSATGWPVLGYVGTVVVATVFMYLPGGARWFS